MTTLRLTIPTHIVHALGARTCRAIAQEVASEHAAAGLPAAVAKANILDILELEAERAA